VVQDIFLSFPLGNDRLHHGPLAAGGGRAGAQEECPIAEPVSASGWSTLNGNNLDGKNIGTGKFVPSFSPPCFSPPISFPGPGLFWFSTQKAPLKSFSYAIFLWPPQKKPKNTPKKNFVREFLIAPQRKLTNTPKKPFLRDFLITPTEKPTNTPHNFFLREFLITKNER
jgi:hypothetical protein